MQTEALHKTIPQNIQDWSGHDAVVIATGPSLTQEDVNYVEGKAKVVIVNDAYKIAPFADCLFAADKKWWEWHNGVPGFEGQKWTSDEQMAKKYNLCFIRKSNGKGFSRRQDTLHTGGNSGYQALNLAYLFGANRLIMLGFDHKISSDGKSHFFGDHPDEVRSRYSYWRRFWEDLAAQKPPHKIINCTRDTTLDMFTCKPLEEVL
jgi:hypothetical protein